MPKHVRLLLITLVLITLQTTIVSFTSIANIIPDVMLIWIVTIAVTQGQIPATVYGFGIGLVLDLVSGQFLGLSALSKTVAGFLAGYFYHENKIGINLANYQFLIFTGTAAFAHNLIYFIIFTQGSDVDLFTAVFRFGLFSTLYTTFIAAIPMFINARKPMYR
ncbi:MAG: rod shape-determining protein MreD [Bacteroidetes bacterium]|nr:rod shape-determining protein MreD [Bacteroidota bacterium]